MARTIGYIAQSERTPTLEEQREALGSRADIILSDGETSLTTAKPQLRHFIRTIAAGDTLLLHSLAVVPMALRALVPILARLERRGVTVELVAEGLALGAGGDTGANHLLRALEVQRRLVIGMQTRSSARANKGRVRYGRRPSLHDDQWPAIKAQIAEPGAKLGEIAASLSVSRSTLYQFVRKHREAAEAG